jgi:hypothetical protein
MYKTKSWVRALAVPVAHELAPDGAATHESLCRRESLVDGGWLIPGMVHSLARSQKNLRKSQKVRTPRLAMILISDLGLFGGDRPDDFHKKSHIL